MILLLVRNKENKVREGHTLAVLGRTQLMLNVKKVDCHYEEKESHTLGSKVTPDVSILLCP